MKLVQHIVIQSIDADQRLDRFLKRKFPLLKQSQIEKICRKGEVRIDGARCKPATRLVQGNEVRVPPLKSDDISLNEPRISKSGISEKNAKLIRDAIIYKDDELIIINKPAGLPSQGGSKQSIHVDGLSDAIIFEKKERPRLVHRLDKDTSGLMLVAKTEIAHVNLSDMFKNHSIERIYQLLVWNVPDSNGLIDQPIGRSKFNRKKMAINFNGKKAVTHWTLLQTFSNLVSLISCKLQEPLKTHGIIFLENRSQKLVVNQSNKMIESWYSQKIRGEKIFPTPYPNQND